MRAVITGASGFIGSNLADHLTGLGHQVLGLDRQARTNPDHDQIVLDLCDRSALPILAKTVAWADVVFHLAARPGIRSVAPRIDELRRRDIVETTRSVLQAVHGSTRVVVASSSSVYGGARRARQGWVPSSEADRPRPVGGYARRKLEMEGLCAGWNSAGDKNLVVARPFTVIGERQRPDMAVSLWLDATLRGQPIRVLGSLHRARDVTDVRKVVSALTALAVSDFRGIINLGGGRPRTLGEIIEAVFNAVGRETDILIEGAPRREAEVTFADSRRARALGFELSTDLGETVKRQAKVQIEREWVPA